MRLNERDKTAKRFSPSRPLRPKLSARDKQARFYIEQNDIDRLI